MKVQYNPDFIQKHRVLVLGHSENGVEIGSCEPLDPSLKALLQRFHGKTCFHRLLSREEFFHHSRLVLDPDESIGGPGKTLSSHGQWSAAPVASLVQMMVEEAMGRNASDIHLEPDGSRGLKVRFRINGVLVSQGVLSPTRAFGVLNRIKMLGGLDPSERRLAQDGRFDFATGGGSWDVRVATVPAFGGEALNLRLLPPWSPQGLSPEALGFEPQLWNHMLGLVDCSSGVILITGPTGSGKTTTLHSLLEQINGGGRKIITIEDPVEIHNPNLVQVQVNEEIGLGFAPILRHILRQDPDVLMVGEIRDGQTASMAFQGGSTGHLVLASIHGSSLEAVLRRLGDLGLGPAQWEGNLRAVVVQRLEPRLCDHCGGGGCSHCGQSGRGRPKPSIQIFEKGW